MNDSTWTNIIPRWPNQRC